MDSICSSPPTACLSRTDWLRQRDWDLVILDEAQAIKNSGTRQSRSRQGTEGSRPRRHDGHSGRESPVRSLVAVRFSQPGPAGQRQDVCQFRQADGGQFVLPAAAHPRRTLHLCAGSRPTSE